MNVPASVLQHHVNYTIWASRRLLKAVDGLYPEQLNEDFRTADRSIAGTLAHVFRSERIWLARIKGGEDFAGLSSPSEGDFTYVIEKWPVVHQDWKTWASELIDEDASRLIAYHDMKGRPWTDSLWHIVFHVVNHSTHHRGQVSGFLRTLGETPPPLDFVAYVREGSPQQ